MNLAYFIAKRYFLSKKKKSFINVISIISMLVVAIGTMALIIVLSVFNGLEGLLRNLYGTVDPNLVVSANVGKSFVYGPDISKKVNSLEEILSITEVLEDNVLIKYNNAQRVARVKGVSESFIEQGRLEDYLVFGDLKLTSNDISYAIVGRGVQYDLSINPKNDFYTIQMYFPDEVRPGMLNPEKMYRLKNILPGGVFAVEKSYDENLVYVPIRFAEDLFNKKGKRNHLELQLVPSAKPNEVKKKLQDLLGPSFLVQSNDEIHGDLYRVLSYEKFFVFLTFSIIIAIASINIFFSLNMLVLDKKKDVAILAAQGASRGLITKIFLLEGCIVAFTGAFTGLLLGLLVSFVQQEFGLVTMGMQTAIIDAYPVKVQWLDVFLTVLSIIVITIVTSIQPALSASKSITMTDLQ
ncbi:MAG: FtsX-like permease family protein [Marinoscillum sp.]|uniref:ABC transporter permease n=1 Tax=Marinoscillum sp. TaxID=2024838 RepID=UPI0032F950B4